jgi:hypothetical protein
MLRPLCSQRNSGLLAFMWAASNLDEIAERRTFLKCHVKGRTDVRHPHSAFARRSATRKKRAPGRGIGGARLSFQLIATASPVREPSARF